MRWRCSLAAAVVAVLGVAAAQSSPAAFAACPSGVPHLALGPAKPPAQGAGAHRKPAVFALPSELDGPLSAAHNGSWTVEPDGGRIWKLCLQAPLGTPSLMLLFTRLRLPLRSELRIHAPRAGTACAPGACQIFTAFHSSGAGSVPTVPLPGNALSLTYTQPPGAVGDPIIEIGSVLQGVAPLPAPMAPPQTDAGRILAPTKDVNDQGDDLSAELSAAAAQGAGPDATPGPPQGPSLSEILAGAVDNQSGASLPCLLDASCAPPWRNVSSAVVLLLLASAHGGRFCTGTLVNAPAAPEILLPSTSAPAPEAAPVAAAAAAAAAAADDADDAGSSVRQYIVTANHCRGQDDALTIATLWGAVFSHDQPCPSAAAGAVVKEGTRPSTPRVAPYQVMQGLELVWANEDSDVMLLQLNNEIPEAFGAYFLGWDASAPPRAPSGSLTIHHSAGDAKKLTQTSLPLTPVFWKVPGVPTHVRANWTQGVTETGSSGATLVDAGTGLGVGVLTGGGLARSCRGGSEDMFGTLWAAWDLGLWRFLSPEGPDARTRMEGRPAAADGPGLLVLPARLVLRETTQIKRVLQVKLSDPPAPGEVVTVSVAVLQPASPPGRAPVAVADPTLTFDASNWNATQLVEVLPGVDPLPAPLPFRLTLDAASSARPGWARRRVVPGLRTDEGVPAGLTPDVPITLTGGPAGVQARDAAALAGAEGQGPFRVARGQRLVAPAALGSVAFFNLTTSQTVGLGVAACSGDAPLQVAVYNDSVAAWTSTEECASADNPGCVSMDRRQQCSGFLGLELPGTGENPPYTLAVSTLDGAPARFALQVSQLSREGALFAAGDDGGGD